MPSGLWSNLIFLTNGETETQREVLLVLKVGLKSRLLIFRVGSRMMQRKVFRAREACFYIPSPPMTRLVN